MNTIFEYINEIYLFFVELGNYLADNFMIIFKNPLYFSLFVLVINLILLLLTFRNNRKLMRKTIGDTCSFDKAAVISFTDNTFDYNILFSKKELIKVIKILYKNKVNSCLVKLKDNYKKSISIGLFFDRGCIKINNDKYNSFVKNGLLIKFFEMLKNFNDKDVFVYDDNNYIIRFRKNKYFLIKPKFEDSREIDIYIFNSKDVNYFVNNYDKGTYVDIRFIDGITNYRFTDNISNMKLMKFLGIKE